MLLELKENHDFMYHIFVKPGLDFNVPLPLMCKAYDVLETFHPSNEEQIVTGIFVNNIENVLWIDICQHSNDPNNPGALTLFRIGVASLKKMVELEKTDDDFICVSNPFISSSCPWPLSLTRNNKLSVVVASLPSSNVPTRVKALYRLVPNHEPQENRISLPRLTFAYERTKPGQLSLFKEISRFSKLKEIRLFQNFKAGDFQIQIVSFDASNKKRVQNHVVQNLLSTPHLYQLFPLMDFTGAIGINIQWSFSNPEQSGSYQPETMCFGFLIETEMRILPLQRVGGLADYQNVNESL